jgi:transcriptional regulator with PAS, ATPase and Fis domain
VGAALFETLPAALVEVADGDALLFSARREVQGAAQTEAHRDGVMVRVTLGTANAGRLFQPLLESAASLVALAAERAEPLPKAAHVEPPRAPEPPSVVPSVQRLYTEAAQAARGEVSILIRGESGTGKEVLARYLHAASSRAAQRFVALNCAALPRDLLEAELFGIERGVATGVEARAGKFELADGGTLFLDEIGDMAPDTQARILRVLQEKEVFRIGGSAPRRADVRVIAATHRQLSKLIETGAFRQDLYYRIAAWVLELPALRARRADIPQLAAHFLGREAAQAGVRVRGISRAALEVLEGHPWPGNVRQLEKEMARAALLLDGRELLEASCLSRELREEAARPAAPGLKGALEEAERRAIERALEDAAGDIDRAAAELGLGRSTLYRRIKELAIAVPPAPRG